MNRIEKVPGGNGNLLHGEGLPSPEGEPKTGTTFIIIDEGGAILMQQRDDGKGKKILYPNMWCFPGEGTEPTDENIEMTAARGIDEELSLKIDPKRLEELTLYTHDDGIKDTVFVFRPTNIEKNIMVPQEGQGMRWMPLDEVMQLELAWEQDRLLPFVNEYCHDETKWK